MVVVIEVYYLLCVVRMSNKSTLMKYCNAGCSQSHWFNHMLIIDPIHFTPTGRQGQCGQRGGAVRGQGGAARSQRAARQGPGQVRMCVVYSVCGMVIVDTLKIIMRLIIGLCNGNWRQSLFACMWFALCVTLRLTL